MNIANTIHLTQTLEQEINYLILTRVPSMLGFEVAPWKDVITYVGKV